ncbi:MAG TPA: hypothetical protein PLG91_06395, partial [Ferruginibacter sp.]|nr:hypothetical protein [Ferruginibacter sp.]
MLKGKPESWLALIQQAEISGIETGVLYAVEMRLIAAAGFFKGGNNVFVDIIKLDKAGGAKTKAVAAELIVIVEEHIQGDKIHNIGPC